MTAKPLALPDGRAGQALAVALTLLAVLLVWVAAVAPAIRWYEGRQIRLEQQHRLAAHLRALDAALPALRRDVAASKAHEAARQVLLPGDSDAIAAANLQSALQTLAGRAGASLDSAALLQAKRQGPLRRIAMRVSVTATWPVLIAFLRAIETAHPRMVVGTISITSPSQIDPKKEPKVQASLSVIGFRAAAK